MKKSTLTQRIKKSIWKTLTITTLAAMTLSPVQTQAQATRTAHKSKTESCTVYTVSKANRHGKRLITIETGDGNLFTFTSAKRWKKSDKGVATFDTKRTKSRKDDVVTSVKKSKDLYLTHRYIEKHYKGCSTVKFIKEGKQWQNIKLKTRRGKHIVYIEVIKSVSRGDWGRTTKYDSYIKYNKPVRKGKKVTSYCIYNPNCNYYDDVTAVIDNGMIR